MFVKNVKTFLEGTSVLQQNHLQCSMQCKKIDDIQRVCCDFKYPMMSMHDRFLSALTVPDTEVIASVDHQVSVLQ